MSVANRRPNDFLYDLLVLGPYEHAEVTATTTGEPLFRAPRAMRVTAVRYYNETGLAEAAVHAFKVAVHNGATEIASWNTDSDLSEDDMSIPAAEWIDLALAADTADLVLAAGDSLHLVLTEGAGATATLPAGRFQVEAVLI